MLEKVYERSLPSAVIWPFDVRFEDEDTVLLAAGKTGIYRLSIADPKATPEVVVPADEVTFVTRLAVSDQWIVAGTPFGPLGWVGRDGKRSYRQDVPMGVIVDLDVSEDQVWMLGSRRDEKGVWAPEGAILWSAELDDESVKGLQPRMQAESGPGAEEMARCHVLELGAVRHLGDGRWAVAPGVQPGVFLYAKDGKLLHAWQSDDLGFRDRCGLDKEQFLSLNAEPVPRYQWFNQQRLLDDLLPWEDWPALLLRDSTPDGPQWEIVVLGKEGPVRRLAVPVSEAGPNARMRGDVFGELVVLVILELEISPSDPKVQSRLVLLRRAPE